MWKLAVGFVVFAAISLFVIMKAGDQVTQVIVGTKAEALVEAMKKYL